MFQQSRESLVEQARRLNHPDPEHADQGEINVLELYSMRRPLTAEEAKHYLRVAEFDAGFHD